MKNLLLATISLFLTSSICAQVGVSAVYSTMNTSGWDDIMTAEGVTAYDNGFIYGFDYWFRLKDYRVEFLPEVSYGSFDNIIDGETLVAQNVSSELDIFAFSFNTHIYIFDIEGDCNCPTWGKEGGVFNKGFYLMAGPGVAFFRHDDIVLKEPFENPTLLETNTTRFTIAAGIGLDIGITKAITITPFGRFKWYAPGTWEALESLTLSNGTQDMFEDFDSSVTQLHGGLRLSYRWGQ